MTVRLRKPGPFSGEKIDMGASGASARRGLSSFEAMSSSSGGRRPSLYFTGAGSQPACDHGAIDPVAITDHVTPSYRPHRPLKVGIAADIPARCPAVERRVLSVALSAYARRVMYLRALVAGAARVDLDGNPAGEVTAGDAEYAAAKLAEILASRETKRAAAVDKGAAQVAKPAAARAAAAAPPAVKVVTLKKRPVLRLSALRQQGVNRVADVSARETAANLMSVPTHPEISTGDSRCQPSRWTIAGNHRA